MAISDTAFNWLKRTGIVKDVSKTAEALQKLTVTTKTVPVKRPPEYPSQTPQGAKEGWSTKGDVASTAKKGTSFSEEADTKGGTGDGWPSKPAGSPAAPRTKDGWTKGGAFRATETKSPNVDPDKTAKRVSANKANIEGNESAMYEKLEKKSLRSLKGGGTEKELREGHNTGKSMKPGGGGRFAKLKGEIAAKGKVKDPGAVAAAIGKKKYGSKQMEKWSAAGRKKG